MNSALQVGLTMNEKVVKTSCLAGVILHLFVLSTVFAFGDGILFGFRYFDEAIQAFTGIEMTASVVAIVLIFKDKQIGFVLLGLSIASTYVIQFGHRIFWWPCEYCRL
jgi:hypothetical protein